ncbi:MAG: hypothetical protein BJ554DRAFT_4630 [Olpidium bornovanus]|uniref:Uncharacterized protein n=1 Tax=Olpidium bornovanus TaxID=278681 RepID=A0A8H7ZLV3_9FUNG|nr:MAG: hypothetical protein BJ554DRAFT_4630 [Olpidium bornovanus]
MEGVRELRGPIGRMRLPQETAGAPGEPGGSGGRAELDSPEGPGSRVRGGAFGPGGSWFYRYSEAAQAGPSVSSAAAASSSAAAASSSAFAAASAASTAAAAAAGPFAVLRAADLAENGLQVGPFSCAFRMWAHPVTRSLGDIVQIDESKLYQLQDSNSDEAGTTFAMKATELEPRQIITYQYLTGKTLQA